MKQEKLEEKQEKLEVCKEKSIEERLEDIKAMVVSFSPKLSNQDRSFNQKLASIIGEQSRYKSVSIGVGGATEIVHWNVKNMTHKSWPARVIMRNYSDDIQFNPFVVNRKLHSNSEAKIDVPV